MAKPILHSLLSHWKLKLIRTIQPWARVNINVK